MKREMLELGERHGIPASELQGLDILAVVDAIVERLDDQGKVDEAGRVRQEAFDTLERIELAHSDEASVVPGALELLFALREADMKIGIVTRNCRGAVQISLDRTGVFYDVLLTRDDVRNTKPHPDHLLQALEVLDVQPGGALMVGDHWMDIQGGRAAGTRTVGFLRPDRPDGFFDVCPPDLIIRDIGELLPYLERLKE
jgi:HAD superfamily hydrolase (TIGR01549 family)